MLALGDASGPAPGSRLAHAWQASRPCSGLEGESTFLLEGWVTVVNRIQAQGPEADHADRKDGTGH